MRVPGRIAIILWIISPGCSYSPVQLTEADCIPQSEVAGLRVAPTAISDLWLEERLVRQVTIEEPTCAPLAGLEILSAPPWADVSLQPGEGLNRALLTVEIDPTSLAVGLIVDGVVRLGRGGIEEARVGLHFRYSAPLQLRVGATEFGCPEATAGRCDAWGSTALEQVFVGISVPSVWVTVYADESPTIYEGPVEMGAGTWLRAADGLGPGDIVVRSRGKSRAALEICGDDTRVSGIGIVLGSNGEAFLDTSGRHCSDTSWISEIGHVFENIDGLAAFAEENRSNGIGGPFIFEKNVTVRNSRFAGHFELDFRFNDTSNVTIVNNTFALFQEPDARLGLEGDIDVSGSVDLVFANNVLLSVARPVDVAFVSPEGLDAPQGLVVVGNYFEGFGRLLDPDFPADESMRLHANGYGPGFEVQVESPYRPIFLSDSGQLGAEGFRPPGMSLDGVPLDEVDELLPGAFQRRSELSGPRRMLVRVGPASVCGVDGCEITTDVDNEIQKAIWSSWPGGTVSISAAQTPYAGDAVISWPVHLRGASSASKVPLENRVEDPLLESVGVFSSRDAVLALLWSAHGSSIENLAVTVRPESDSRSHAITAEMRDQLSDPRPIRLRNLVLYSEALAYEAISFGPRTELQDVLIIGQFRYCGGWLDQNSAPARRDSTALIANVTCRLTDESVEAGFNITQAASLHMINLVLSLPSRPAFVASSSGINPGVLTVSHSTAHGLSVPSSSLDWAQHSIDIDFVTAGLFLSEVDSRLTAESGAIDTGLDPTEIGLPEGRGINGVQRVAGSVDRGAFEQDLP